MQFSSQFSNIFGNGLKMYVGKNSFPDVHICIWETHIGMILNSKLGIWLMC